MHVVSRIPGIVREVRKNLGDTVRAGDVMAVIDSRELADAKGAYLAATERVSLTADTFQREKDLWEKKISPAEDYFKAKQALPKRALNCALAKQKLLALGFSEPSLKQFVSEPDASLTRYEMWRPLAGTVIEKHLNVGEFIKDDTEIFHVADLRTVWVNLNVPPADLLPASRKASGCACQPGQVFPKLKGASATLVPWSRKRPAPFPCVSSSPTLTDAGVRGCLSPHSLTTKETTPPCSFPKPPCRPSKAAQCLCADPGRL